MSGGKSDLHSNPERMFRNSDCANIQHKYSQFSFDFALLCFCRFRSRRLLVSLFLFCLPELILLVALFDSGLEEFPKSYAVRSALVIILFSFAPEL